MATPKTKPLFIDTNILVYANVVESPRHESALAAIRLAQMQARPLWISRQVLREYAVVMTRPQTFMQPMARETVCKRLEFFAHNFFIAEDNATTSALLLGLLRAGMFGGKQVHDANIVATMQAYEICAILTCNTSDFSCFTDLITIETID